jgi:CheY-like chemotaxis protein/anti-sigma regulatory factor (Ser/Thr protein kinase)
MWEEQRSVGVIAESAAFIDRLVREMLEMAYLESEQVEVHPEATELAPFLKTVLERTVSTSDRSRIRLDVLDMATGMIEPNRIERVVVNFVQNAIKYAPPDSPILVRLETRGTMAEVSVVDQGPGLRPEEESYVFEKYRRTPAGMKRDGLGLGLYISRKIVEAHSGRIGVEKNPGRGTRFYFKVPLVPQEPRKVPFTITLEPGAFEDHRARLRGVHVLLVEDEANALSALTALLSEEGVAVTAAASGEEALRLAKSRLPDIAVVDVEMPGMSGLALLKQLRELKRDLPAVIMSGFMSHHAGIAQARETKGTNYIGKPVDVDELIRHIGRLLPV